jgi:hypothetical protein
MGQHPFEELELVLTRVEATPGLNLLLLPQDDGGLLRVDFYDRPLMHPHFSELVSQRTQVVVPMTPKELERSAHR